MKNKRYNNIEEWANTLSHGIGILLGIVAGYLLLEKASENIEPQWAVACVSVYLAGMLSSYVSSTWYHGSRPGKLKELLRKFDHGAIYLHIAGTYTLLDHLGELEATTAFWWLIGGGVSYIVGAVFYSLRKPYMHATFHLFCLGGSIGHIIAIWLIL